MFFFFKCCSTSTVTVRTIRGEARSPGRPPPLPLQLLSFDSESSHFSSSVLLYVQRHCTDCLLVNTGPGRPPRLSHSESVHGPISSRYRFMVCLCGLAVPCAVMVQCVYMCVMLEDVSSVELRVLVIACCVGGCVLRSVSHRQGSAHCALPHQLNV